MRQRERHIVTERENREREKKPAEWIECHSADLKSRDGQKGVLFLRLMGHSNFYVDYSSEKTALQE